MTRKFVALPMQEFTVDTESRVIEGVTLPWGAVGNGARFERGALKWADESKVKLNLDHDRAQTVGVATSIKDTTKGLHVKFRVARTPEGDRALTLAEDGVYDGFSIEIPDDDSVRWTPDPRRKSGQLIQDAALLGVALTPSPAFTDARVSRVKFDNEEDTVPDTDVEPTPAPEPTPAAPAPAQFAAPDPVPFVNPIRPTAQTQVTEVPYRFNRQGTLVPGTADFGIDIVRAAQMQRPDSPEHRRVLEFMARQFAVESSDVNELNPTLQENRYIDELERTYPLWSAVNRGNVRNGIQPWVYPIFSTASGLVGAHTEGQEPASGTYATANHAVITPAPISGKVSITRETWDMGGQPNVGDIIWRRILRDWFESLEAKVVTTLAAAGASSLGTFTPGGGNGAANSTTKTVLLAQLQRYMAALQYARGGNRFDRLFAHQGLFDGLVSAQDTQGRPVLPILSPSNANGTVGSRFSGVDFAGVPVIPAWAVGTQTATATGTSFLIDSGAVDGYASSPSRLTFDQTAVATVELAVWGYAASAVNDPAGVRTLAYQNLT